MAARETAQGIKPGSQVETPLPFPTQGLEDACGALSPCLGVEGRLGSHALRALALSCEAVTSRGDIFTGLTPLGPPGVSAGAADDQEEQIAASSTGTCGQAGTADGFFFVFTGGGVADLTHTPDPAISSPGTAAPSAGESACPTTRPELLRLPADRLEHELWRFFKSRYRSGPGLWLAPWAAAYNSA